MSVERLPRQRIHFERARALRCAFEAAGADGFVNEKAYGRLGLRRNCTVSRLGDGLEYHYGPLDLKGTLIYP